MMKRNAKNLALALLVGAAFLASTVELIAQSPQPSTSDKAQSPATTPNATAAAKSTPAASTDSSTTSGAPAQASATTKTPANAKGLVWINTDTGVYHKQGTRWYGKTKHGKYMLEGDAIKAGYKPAK